jgi:hypothetical protein
MAQAIQHLPSKSKALSSNPIAKKKKRHGMSDNLVGLHLSQ